MPPPPLVALVIALGPLVSDDSAGAYLVDLGKLAAAITFIGAAFAGAATVVVKVVRKDMSVGQIPEILAIVTELRDMNLDERVTVVEQQMDDMSGHVTELSAKVEVLVRRDAAFGGRRHGDAPGDLTP